MIGLWVKDVTCSKCEETFKMYAEEHVIIRAKLYAECPACKCIVQIQGIKSLSPEEGGWCERS